MRLGNLSCQMSIIEIRDDYKVKVKYGINHPARFIDLRLKPRTHPGSVSLRISVKNYPFPRFAHKLFLFLIGSISYFKVRHDQDSRHPFAATGHGFDIQLTV
jgi:hypothetical protein